MGSSDIPLPPVSTWTAPRQKKLVPIVTTSEGTPTLVMITPFSAPARKPAINMSSSANHRLPVRVRTVAKIHIPKAMIEVNDRSISPVMTTMVRGSATMPKKGVADINAR